MSQVVIALYESSGIATSAIEQLKERGFGSNDIALITHHGARNPDAGSKSPLGKLFGSNKDQIHDLPDALHKLGVAEDYSGYFAEGVRRGHALVIVQADEASVDNIYGILEGFRPIDVNERAARWRDSGWTGFQPEAAPYTETEAAEERERYAEAPAETPAAAKTADEAVVPVVEEKLEVGKREVDRGGIRVYKHVVTTPIEEVVHLREERVRVDRRPVDRPADEQTLDTFEEGTIEVTTRAEEPVVSKHARVIEEVVIHKDVAERTETVRDTVRRTDVEVEGGAQPAAAGAAHSDYSAHDEEFRTHYQTNFADTGYTYDQFAPAYRFGHTLGTHESYRSAENWNVVEPEARRHWEEHNEGTWDTFKEAIRHGYEKVRR